MFTNNLLFEVFTMPAIKHNEAGKAGSTILNERLKADSNTASCLIVIPVINADSSIKILRLAIAKLSDC